MPSGLSFNLLSYFPIFFLYSPIFFLFLFAGIFDLFKKKDYRMIYLYYIFFISLFVISCFTNWIEMRYILCIMPIFILLSLIGINSFIDFLIYKVDNKKYKIEKFVWISVLVLFFIFIIITKNYNVNSAFGFNSSFRNTKGAIFYILKNKKKNDILICNNISVGSFYLNSCDYQIKQEVISKSNKLDWSELDYQIKPNYYNINFINSTNRLEGILNNNDRIWIFLDKRNFGSKLYEYIKNNFQLKYQNFENDSCIYLYEKK